MPFSFAARRTRALTVLAALALLACAERPRAGASSAAADDFGVTVAAKTRPARIVSLNPATTEILFALGAGSRLVGRSEWDLWPDSARLVPSLGPALRPNVEAVLAARPDLVVLYASEDNRGAAGRLRSSGIATVAVRGDRIADFRRVVLLLGDAVGAPERARAVVDSVDGTLERVRAGAAGARRPRVFIHVWDDPVITVGAGSYLHELVELAGATNVYADIPGPSAQVALEDVVRRDPDLVLAGPAGAARMRSDAAWRAVRAVREGRIAVGDTTLIGRPSVKLGEAAVSLLRLFHPERAP